MSAMRVTRETEALLDNPRSNFMCPVPSGGHRPGPVSVAEAIKQIEWLHLMVDRHTSGDACNGTLLTPAQVEYVRVTLERMEAIIADGGQPRPDTLRCSTCGAPRDGSATCRYCGTRSRTQRVLDEEYRLPPFDPDHAAIVRHLR